MIISDLNYLEEVVESNDVEGGLLNFFSTQSNSADIKQNAVASSGNGLLSILNVGTAVNAAVPIQANA